MIPNYLEPGEANINALISAPPVGEVVMLNLIQLRDVADYSSHPELAPDAPISGREAYQRYMDHTQPFLEASGGEVLFFGEAKHFFIGPIEERWDLVMLVKQASLQSFFAFAQNPECMAGAGHRTAAALDSRLLPVTPK